MHIATHTSTFTAHAPDGAATAQIHVTVTFDRTRAAEAALTARLTAQILNCAERARQAARSLAPAP